MAHNEQSTLSDKAELLALVESLVKNNISNSAINDLKHRIHLIEINLAIIGENHPQVKGIKTLVQELSSIVQSLNNYEAPNSDETSAIVKKIIALIS